MVRAKEYSSDFKKAVVEATKTGLLEAQVSRQFRVCRQIVNKWVKKDTLHGTTDNQPRSGRPKKTTARQDFLICRESKKNPRATATSIWSDLTKSKTIDVSITTVKRRLNAGGLFGRRPSRKPLISAKNRKARVDFAKKYLKWTPKDWARVLWSDESKYKIFSSDGIQYIRRPKNKRNDVRYQVPTVKHGGGSVMVWGCFSRDGVGPLHLIEGIMNGPKYTEIVQNVMLPHAKSKMAKNWLFQQDNDPKHTSKVAKDCFKSKKIKVLEWPSQSPVMNPIEHLWEELDMQVRLKNNTSKEVLFSNLKECWKNIKMDKLIKLVDSMPDRLRAVIDAKGYATKY